MPFKITGKILDDQGYPLYQVATVTEMPLVPGIVTGANVWTDEDTGAFTFFAMNENSMMKVESIGYKPTSFIAKNFPAVVKLQPALTLTGSPKKKDNSLLWVLGGIAAAVAIGVATKKGKAVSSIAPKAVKTTAAKPKPKVVIV